MPDTTHIQRLLGELLESGQTPEEACRDRPDLLPLVRERWVRMRMVESELEAMFPATASLTRGPASRPPIGGSTELPLIPGYEVEAVLGRGGMGVVYKAKHLRLNRSVAVKMLLAGAYASSKELESLAREAESVAGLRHPNIVQVYDVSDLGGLPYFTMELVEGGTLAQKLKGVPQPVREAASMVATLAEAVESAHRSGVVHRDLKPANVMLTSDGIAKIADFGLARRFEGGPALTLSGALVGSPSYMAPEQAAGKAQAFCPAVDIYALGAILYEMLTGRPPFRADTAAETARQVVTEEPAPPSRLNARVPRDLETICLKCLHKDPSRRYASAADLGADLGRFMGRRPIHARPVGRSERAMRWVGRNPTVAALVVAVLTLLGVAAGAAAREWNLGVQRRAEAANWASRLEFINGLQRERRFTEARAILGRIPDAGSDELRRHIIQARNELSIIESLDAIRLRRGASGQTDFLRAADLEYQREFERWGLGTVGEPPAAVAQRIAAMHIRGSLVEALDDWASCTREWGRLVWILAVARLADPHPQWRDRFRTPEMWRDPARIRELADGVNVAEQSAPLLLVLGCLLDEAGGDSVAFLRRVHAAHPSDFWVHFVLAEVLESRGDTESLGHYRAALALRPGAVSVHVNLGTVLRARGRTAEAMDHWRRALELDPESPLAHQNLAIASLEAGELDQAIEHARLANRLDPPPVHAPAVLGHALARQRRFAEAQRALRRALELLPEDDPLRPHTAELLADCDAALALEVRLPSILLGAESPADAAECVRVALLLLHTSRYANAATFFERALTDAPGLAEDLSSGQRYNAACAAVLAGSDRDESDGELTEEDRRRWRSQARRWLHADLAAWSTPDGRDEVSPARLRATLAHWRTDPDLAGIRDPREVDALPASEQAECRSLWQRVDELLASSPGEP